MRKGSFILLFREQNVHSLHTKIEVLDLEVGLFDECRHGKRRMNSFVFMYRVIEYKKCTKPLTPKQSDQIFYP